MTVKELMDVLSKLPPDLQVWATDDEYGDQIVKGAKVGRRESRGNDLYHEDVVRLDVA